MITGADASGVLIYVLGAASGYAAVRYRLLVSDRASQISDHIKDLEKLHEFSLTFWSSDFDPEKGSERKMRVLSSHAISIRIYPEITQMALGRSESYNTLISEYFRACTGGDFDNPDRRADLTRAIELSSTHAQLIKLLRDVRGDLSSVAMLRRDISLALLSAWRAFHDTFLTP